MALSAGWSRANALLQRMPQRWLANQRNAADEVGEVLVRMARDGIESQNPGGAIWSELHPWTVMNAGGRTEALTGLIPLVSYRIEDSGRVVWFGIGPEAGRTAEGTPWSLVARVLEYGATVHVTPAMRAYLHAHDMHLRPDTEVIVIPPRPWIAPTLRDAQEFIRGAWRRALMETLFGR